MIDIVISQALKIVDRTLEPERLNTVEELVLKECWAGKTYQEIATDSGYDSDYIRVVGSRLWQSLSNAFEEKVTKNNFKSVLRQQARKREFAWFTLELPDGQVPLNSDFYIERPPHETIAYEEIVQPGALIRIKSPLSTGKTSLMIRILAHARSQNYHAVTINFQLAESSVLSDLNKFLRWLMANITLQLGLESKMDDYWDEDLGMKVSCTTYLQGHILQQLTEPLVLALDEVNYLFEYPSIAREFLPLIRFWHEETNNCSIWKNLRLIVVHSTDIYLPLNINQSPLNLGFPLKLKEFDFEQMKDLASRHQFRHKLEDLDRQIKLLMETIGGYPYLARLAFYALSTEDLTLDRLLAEAPTSSGIYRNYLQGHLSTLKRYPELGKAYEQVVLAERPVKISPIDAYKLESIGLIKLFDNTVAPSCLLYRLYFSECLQSEIE
ncbi:MAG: AAA-like domain-containing protein [Cyanobacteria bacterium P01_G01_bin.19]